MKLKITDTTSDRPKASKWEYSQTQIDLTDLRQLRFAIYDNGYDPKTDTQRTHIFEPKRYRCELQVWTEESKDCQYKLFNYLGNYKTFRNNKYKDSLDQYGNWYKKDVEFAKELATEFGSDSVVTHACLGLPKHHAGRTDGSFGFYTMPQWTMHMLINPYICNVWLHIEDQEVKLELENTSVSTAGNGAKLYYRKVDVGVA